MPGATVCVRSKMYRLHFVWESGPSIVFWNITIRIIVAFLPVGIGIIGRYIIDGVNQIRLHQPLPQNFWWLVGGEMTLAVVTGMLSRSVDYFDNLLADRYTHHVSVEVMRKAAALDVTVYEDPVFYDRLERARVQATDRLAMIQQMGRLIHEETTAMAELGVLLDREFAHMQDNDVDALGEAMRARQQCVARILKRLPASRRPRRARPSHVLLHRVVDQPCLNLNVVGTRQVC